METAVPVYMTKTIDGKSGGVQSVSKCGSYAPVELIESAELAARWRVPESWVRNRTRAHTPREERIPCVRLGRYVRFEWGSTRLQKWLEKKRQY
jgi:hypothetical protein